VSDVWLYISLLARLFGRQFPNMYLELALQTLDRLDRTSKRSLRSGQLRGHINFDSRRHIQEWLDGRGSQAKTVKVCDREGRCTRGSM
jgi:hypothetical protein